jgi:glyoxylase-like metal-dependent hydrolase (beta-lactamase superfamily II)
VIERSPGEWYEPGAVPVAAGVHRIPLPMPGDGLRAINVYAVADGDQIALIDTGPPHPDASRALDDALASLGASVADVSKVITTHAHYDHYGLASYVRSRSRAEVMLGTQERDLLDVALSRDTYERSVEHRRRWLGQHGARGILDDVERIERDQQFAALHAAGRWEPPDRLLDAGDVVELADRTLQAFWTPGHTRGHLVFHDPDNELLFAGDHVLPHITPSLGFEPFADGRALELFLASLRDVRDLPARLVLPGHGREFTDLAGRVDELVAHHRVRLASCVTAIADDGATSAQAVASLLTWTSRGRGFSELDPFNRMLAVTETVTHLELLVACGRLTRDPPDADTVSYALAA